LGEVEIKKAPANTEVYAVWSDWQGECSVTCGVGKMTLTRRCDAKCAETDKIMGVCPDDPCPSGTKNPELYFKDEECRKEECSRCGWDEWAPWSKCSVTCDLGQKSRKRRCVDYNNNNKECDIEKCKRRGGSEMQPGECVEHETCPVDFYWEEWGDWTNCPVLCRGGKQHRYRYCEDGHHGGKKCVKKRIEEERECSGKYAEFEC